MYEKRGCVQRDACISAINYKLSLNSQLGILERLLLGVRRLEEEPDTTPTAAHRDRLTREERNGIRRRERRLARVKKSCEEKTPKLSTKMGFRRKFMKISKSNPFHPKPQSQRHAVTRHHDALVDSIST
jgi:CRISPR/Cas system Type II protein with McrA/HNH and RuvC-like nuclease domain